jgi:hypothetical protein
VPRTIASVITASQNKTAALRDLEEHLSTEDLYNLLEISMIEAHNAKKVREAAEREQ